MAPNRRTKPKGQKGNLPAIRCSNTKFCSGYLYSPIFGCPNGHNICKTCSAFYKSKCPICSSRISHKADVHLENTARKLLTPCYFKNRGCHFQFPFLEIPSHQQICRYADKSCFSSRCRWSGPIGDLVKHMSSVHKERVFKGPSAEIAVRNFSSRSTGIDTISFITCDLGNFWVRLQYDFDEGEIYGAVQYIGPEQEAEKLQCQFEMAERDDGGELTGLKSVYNGMIYTENDSFDDIFDDFECFNVTAEFARYFEYDEDIEVSVMVKRAN